jgi:hypothetical protein
VSLFTNLRHLLGFSRDVRRISLALERISRWCDADLAARGITEPRPGADGRVEILYGATEPRESELAEDREFEPVG